MTRHAESELIQRADELQRQADRVLEASCLRKILARLGSVQVVGAYCLGLLVRPDIDLIVSASSPDRAAAVRVTKDLLDGGYFQSIVFIDHLTFAGRLDAEMDAKGFYWHLDVPEFEFGQQWKVDIWYLSPSQNRFRDNTNKFRDLLTADPTARETILALKTCFRQGAGYKHGLSGGIICEAVLEHGICSPEELIAFARDRSSA